MGLFGRTVEDVALLAKVLIKKDHHDQELFISAENILKETKKGPAYEPKFIFYKSDYWKIIDKKSRESFEYFIKSFKNIEVFDTPYILRIFINIIKLYMRQIWLIILRCIIKSTKKNYQNICKLL